MSGHHKLIGEIRLHIAHLPFSARLCHRVSIRSIGVFSFSCVGMLISTVIAEHFEGVVVHTMAFSAHGIFLIPIAQSSEVIWKVMRGASK